MSNLGDPVVLHQWLRVPMTTLLERLDAIDRDIQRACKLQNGDRINRLGIWEEDDPDIPPAVCSILDLDGD